MQSKSNPTENRNQNATSSAQTDPTRACCDCIPDMRHAPSEISDKISQQAAKDYQKFMTTKTYTDYTKAYEVFLKKNPGYEDKIAGKLNG